MVCVTEEETIICKVRYESNEEHNTASATANAKNGDGRVIAVRLSDTVSDVSVEVSKILETDESLELFLEKRKDATLLPLTDSRNKLLKDVGVCFERGAENTFVVREQVPACNGLCGNGDGDELVLGASASPTSMEGGAGGSTEAAASSSPSQIAMGVANLTDTRHDIPYVGLVNQAMTCYLNSLLQALFMTPEFRNALYNWEFDGKDPAKSIPYQLQKVFLNLQTSRKSAVETTELTRSFGWDLSEAWQQHDVQELCRVMFDALEQKFKDTAQADLINRLYQGKMLDYVKCLECKREKSREDTFLDIPLPVRPFGSTVAYGSVTEALRAFVQPETLNGNDQYYCENCAKKCDAHKGLKFTEMPYLLTLHLKRFDFDYSTMHRIKLNDKVIFPEMLDLNGFVSGGINGGGDTAVENAATCDDSSTADSGSALDDADAATSTTATSNNSADDEGIEVGDAKADEPRTTTVDGPYAYELFSIMIHSGSANGGHYYAYIKEFESGRWYCFDDQTVTRVTSDDIAKTYGEPAGRFYYSGAYSSSTNAYMLMYRRVEPERNTLPLRPERFPPHLLRLLAEMDAERVDREKASRLIKLRLFCDHPAAASSECKLYLHDESTLAEATREAYRKTRLEGTVPIERCRLVAYDRQTETPEASFEGADEEPISLLTADGNRTDWLLEIRADDERWLEYKPGGVSVRVLYLLDDDLEPEGRTSEVRCREDDTWASFRETLETKLGGRKLQISIENETATVGRGIPRIAVADAVVDRERFLKAARSLDRVVGVDFRLPPTDALTLEVLSIPSLVEAAAATGGGGGGSSEDSSLSDSDRTLVGGDSETESETEPPAEYDYFFKVTDDEETDGAAGEKGRYLRVLFDRRMTLARLKRELEPLVGVPADYFKVFRRDAELTRLAEPLSSARDGDKLSVRLGRALRDNEHPGKVYRLEPNAAEPVRFLCDWVVANGTTVGDVKRELLRHLRLELSPERCRLRKKNWKAPNKVYLDAQVFGEHVRLHANWEMFLQELDGEEPVRSSDQLLLFVRHWNPATMELGPFRELLLDSTDVRDFKRRLSQLSSIPVDDVEFAPLKGTFPFDVSVLTLHQALDWNAPVDTLDSWPLSVYDDGHAFVYRNRSEQLRRLTQAERDEIREREDARSSRLSRSSAVSSFYSPRRERALKIYVDLDRPAATTATATTTTTTTAADLD